MEPEGCICALTEAHLLARGLAISEPPTALQQIGAGMQRVGMLHCMCPCDKNEKLCWPKRGERPQGQTIQPLMWSCGTQIWERAQNNEKYADHDQDAHRAAENHFTNSWNLCHFKQKRSVLFRITTRFSSFNGRFPGSVTYYVQVKSQWTWLICTDVSARLQIKSLCMASNKPGTHWLPGEHI